MAAAASAVSEPSGGWSGPASARLAATDMKETLRSSGQGAHHAGA